MFFKYGGDGVVERRLSKEDMASGKGTVVVVSLTAGEIERMTQDDTVHEYNQKGHTSAERAPGAALSKAASWLRKRVERVS